MSFKTISICFLIFIFFRFYKNRTLDGCEQGQKATPCCGKGPCHAHCCNCKGGCWKDLPQKTISSTKFGADCCLPSNPKRFLGFVIGGGSSKSIYLKKKIYSFGSFTTRTTL